MKLTKRYSIRHMAELLGVTTRTIYNWENAGKIPKPRRDPMSNRRWYTDEDIRRLRKITER